MVPGLSHLYCEAKLVVFVKFTNTSQITNFMSKYLHAFLTSPHNMFILDLYKGTREHFTGWKLRGRFLAREVLIVVFSEVGRSYDIINKCS